MTSIPSSSRKRSRWTTLAQIFTSMVAPASLSLKKRCPLACAPRKLLTSPRTSTRRNPSTSVALHRLGELGDGEHHPLRRTDRRCAARHLNPHHLGGGRPAGRRHPLPWTRWLEVDPHHFPGSMGSAVPPLLPAADRARLRRHGCRRRGAAAREGRSALHARQPWPAALRGERRRRHARRRGRPGGSRGERQEA